jgi:hypothetical protein
MSIEEDNITKINNYKNKKLNPSYLAGLIDGDGCIFIRKIKDGYQSGISLTQSKTNILQIIQYHYGGSIVIPNETFTENIMNEDGFYDKYNKRNSYTLIIRSNEYEFLLNDIYKYIILKKEQIECLMEFSKIANKQDKLEEKNILFEKCTELNKVKDQESYDFTYLNNEYISGLFDAEGYIYINYKKIDNKIRFNRGVYMKITQKNHPIIIDKILEYLNFGKKSEYIYYVDNFENCKKLLEIVKDNVIVKYNQIIAFDEYLTTRLNKNDILTDEINLKRCELYKIINMEKHKIESFENKDNQTNEGYIEKLNKKQILINEEKTVKKDEMNLIRSEMMKGENNPNYGKHLSNEHALNISIETTKTKRANNPNLSDEKITEIYNLKDKMMQKDVAEKYGMNREMIRRIWNKTIVPINSSDFVERKQEKIIEKINNKDNNDNNEKLTSQQKTSIGKRTLNVDEIIEIINWKIKSLNNEKLDGKKIYSTNLSEHLSKIWCKKVTVDMVKNIFNGRTKLFDFEFVDKDITYENYLEIVEK